MATWAWFTISFRRRAIRTGHWQHINGLNRMQGRHYSRSNIFSFEQQLLIGTLHVFFILWK